MRDRIDWAPLLLGAFLWIVIAGLAGCGEALDGSTMSLPLSATWNVEINGGIAPSCAGQMTLTIQRPENSATLVSGSWACSQPARECPASCLTFGGPVMNGYLGSNGTIVFDMQTAPGDVPKFIGVMDRMDFSGHTVLFNGELPLVAKLAP